MRPLSEPECFSGPQPGDSQLHMGQEEGTWNSRIHTSPAHLNFKVPIIVICCSYAVLAAKFS